MADHEDEIKEVMAEEKGRGKRRPTEATARRLKRERMQIVADLLAIPTKRDYELAIKRFGLKPGSAEYEAALRAWHERHDA